MFKQTLGRFQAEALRQRDGRRIDVPALYPICKELIAEHNALLDGIPDHALPVAFDFVNEVVRTAHMLAAQAIAIDEKNSQAVHFVEAGCGTGFFLLTSLLLDRRVYAFGADCDVVSVQTSRFLLSQFPDLRNRLVGLRWQDLESNPDLPFVPDVVIAEHICGDLRSEPIHRIQTRLPRRPTTSFIPHAISTGLAIGFEVKPAASDSLGAMMTIDTKALQVGPEKEIVLSECTDQNIHMEGRFEVPADRDFPLATVMNVTWHRGQTAQVSYGFRENIVALGTNGEYDATLAGPMPIYSYDGHLNPRDLLALHNPRASTQSCAVHVEMPLGTTGPSKELTAEVRCTVESDGGAVEPVFIPFRR